MKKQKSHRCDRKSPQSYPVVTRRKKTDRTSASTCRVYGKQSQRSAMRVVHHVLPIAIRVADVARRWLCPDRRRVEQQIRVLRRRARRLRC